MGIPKSVEQAREYSNNINNVDATLMPQNEQNLAIRYALHDIAKQTGEAPAFNFDYSPVDYDDTLSSEIYKPYVNPLQDALGMLLNAVPSVGAAMLSFPTIMASGGISLLNDALERITGDDYDDPKVQAEKKNWFYDPAARGSIEWTNSVNDFFDSWKYKPSDKAQEKLDVTNFWATANPNNVAANIGNGIGSVLGFIGTIALTKGMSGGGSVKLFQGLSNISKAEVLGSYMYMNNEVYNEFRNNAKIDDLTAAKLSSLVSLPIALSEYVGLSALGKVMTKPMVKNAIKGGVEDALASYGTKGLTKELYQDFTAKAIQGIGNRMTTAALKGAEGAVIEGVQEYGQGKMQQASEALYDKIANEKVFGTELFDKQALKDDINNAFWGGAIGGLLGMGGGMINSKEMQESVFHYVGINLQKNRPAKIDGVKKFITQLGENGKITPEQTEQGLKMVDEMVAVHKEAMPLSLTDIDARYQAYEFIQARNKIQADLLALDEKPVDPTLAKADSELRTIMEQSAEAYDEAIALIAKTKGQISESELGKKLFEIGTQFNKVEAPKEEVKTDITPIENTEELTTETKVEDKIAEIKRRRQEDLDRETPVKNENITVDFGGGLFVKYQVITYKNGSVKISTTSEKSKRYNELSDEVFRDYAKIDFESDAKGIIKTELVKNDYTDKQSQEVQVAKEKTINAKYDAELAALEGKKEEVKVDLAKNEEMLKKAEKALKATITKIEQLKTQPLGAKESQAARDEKIANFEERKKQIETKIGELNAIREAETRVSGVEETGAVVETADTGVGAEEVVEKQIDYNTPIQVNVDVDEKGILSDTKLGIVNKIKEAITPLGVKYKKVVASNKGNRYFVVTKDDKMFEIGRLVANEGKPFPLKLNNKEWVEHAKSIEKTIKEKENKQEVQQKEKAAKLASEYVGESVYYKGKKGVIEKEGDKYVITTDETTYEFNENDFSLEDEKVVLANKKEKSKKTYKVDVVDEKTAIVDGFEYSIVYDKKGNAVALTSKTRTIITEQALIDTDIQIAKLPTTAAEYEVINEQLVSEGYAFNEIEAVDNMLAQNMTDRIANLLDNGFEGVEDIDLLQLELFIENAVNSIDKNFSGLQYAEDIKTQLIEIQKIADNEYDNRFKEKSTESNQEAAASKVKVSPDKVVEEVRVEPDVNEVGQDVQEDVQVEGASDTVNDTVSDAVNEEAELKEPIEEKPTEAEEDKQGFTEAEVLNTIYSNLKQKYGDKKGSELYKVADRLVNPNENTIVEIRSNGVVVKEGDSYLLKPFTNTDANSKKWQLGRPLDVTEQFVDKKSEEDKEPKQQEKTFEEKYGISINAIDEEIKKLKEAGVDNAIDYALRNLGFDTNQEQLPILGDYMKYVIENELPKKIPAKKDLFIGEYLPKGEINPKPIDKPFAKLKDNSEKAKAESLKDIVSDDEIRPQMSGVYHDKKKGFIVATDAQKLVRIKHSNITKDGIFVPKTGKKIDAKFPDYNVVIPTDNPIKINVSLNELRPKIEGMERANKFFVTDPTILANIQVGETDYLFSPKLLNDIFKVFEQYGIDNVTIELSKPNRALVINSGDITALVMPTLIYDYDSSSRRKSTIIKVDEVKKVENVNKEYETISEEIENIEDEKVEEVVNNKIENKKAPKRIYYKGIYTDGDGNFEFVEAENAKPIKLFSVVDAFYTKESGIFVITDTNSGAQIASGKTLKAAIKEAEKVAKSAENLIDVSRRYAEKHGFTPAMKIENAAKLEQDVKNASVENESVEGVIDNMEENGDIQKECN